MSSDPKSWVTPQGHRAVRTLRVKDEHLALGEGSVPWKEVLGILADAQPDLTCTIECSSEESIRRSLQALEGVLI